MWSIHIREEIITKVLDNVTDLKYTRDGFPIARHK